MAAKCKDRCKECYAVSSSILFDKQVKCTSVRIAFTRSFKRGIALYVSGTISPQRIVLVELYPQCFTSYLTFNENNNALERIPKPEELLQREGNADLEKYTATSSYKALHKTTSKCFGQIMANEISKLGNSSPYEIKDIEDQCHAFAMSLITVQSESSNNTQLVSEMVDSLLSGFCSRSFKNQSVGMAILTRCIVTRVGVTRSTLGTLKIFMDACIKHHFSFCKRTAQELAWVCCHSYSRL